MDVEVAVFGCGRIGAGTAALLKELGVDVVVIDRDCGRVRRLEQSLGVEGECLDVLHVGGEAVRHVCRGASVAATAFPGSIGFECVRRVIEAGFEGVADVTFYREDPLSLSGVAREVGAEVYVDAGLAPGLSNLLVGEACGRFIQDAVPIRDALIYVGGLSASRECPLGLAGTWNVRDLLDEYVRPARLVVGGRVVSRDPLSLTGEVEIPGVGRFEYFVSDGLRTMLSTLPRPEGVMAEYTLRYPGHLKAIKILRELGLLSERLVVTNGVPVRPIDVVVARLEEVLRGCREDRVIMYVRVVGEGREAGWVLDVGFDRRRLASAMMLTTSGTQASVVKALLEGSLSLGAGAHGLEEVGLKGLSKHVLRHLSSLGVTPNPV